eukprot:SAG11_NODE_11332_length_768_cov_0.813154_1_plen_116_part_00
MIVLPFPGRIIIVVLSGPRYLVCHSLIRSAMPTEVPGKFSCTVVGTGRKYTPVLFHILPVLGPGSVVLPETITAAADPNELGVKAIEEVAVTDEEVEELVNDGTPLDLVPRRVPS